MDAHRLAATWMPRRLATPHITAGSASDAHHEPPLPLGGGGQRAWGAAMHRRSLLAAATAAALARPNRAGAQEPAAFHRILVGSLTVTVLSDGAAPRKGLRAALLPNADERSVDAALAAADAAAGPDSPYHPTAVGTRAGLVLIDTGLAGLTPGTGRLPASMRAAGLDPAAVTVVALTHLHPDHVSGLLAADGSPAFPNAVVKVAEREWAYWTDEAEVARAGGRRPVFDNVRRRFAPYAGRIEPFKPGAEIAPGINAVAAPGHSPGHSAFLVADGGSQAMVIGDAVFVPALSLPDPEWASVFDMDPSLASTTRRTLLDRVAAERMPVIGYHFPGAAAGRVEKAGTGFRLMPLEG